MIEWVTARVAWESALHHFLAVGATGSGKTLVIRRVVEGVLAEEHQRMLLYDPKQEWASELCGLGYGQRTRLMHPFDERGAAWNMAEDIVDAVSARQLATILVPDPKKDAGGGSKFYNNATRDLLSGVLLAFIQCTPKPRSWTFRDVLLALLYPGYLEAVVQWRDRNGEAVNLLRRLKHAYLEAGTETSRNIVASLNASLTLYEPVAACWAKAKSSVSLTQWLKGNEILVLGNDEAARAAIDPINQAMVKRASELLLAQQEKPDEDKRQGRGLSWVVFDELREAGRLDGLRSLLTKGRSKGVAVVIGFQDIDGLKDVYGEFEALELVAQCQHVAVLRLNSGSTAEWAVGMFGNGLESVRSFNRGVSGNEFSRGSGRSQESRQRIYSRELLELPEVAASKRVHYLLKSSTFWEVDSLPLEDLLPRTRAAQETAYIARPAKDQILEMWSVKDWERLGFEGRPPDPVPFESRKETAEETLRRYRL